MKKVLVTGGAGYIGCVLVKKLLERGYKVKIFDKLLFGKSPIESLLGNRNFEIVQGDILDIESFPSLFDGVESVVHLAALSNDPSCDLDPRDSLKINYEATKRLAELSKEKKIKKFIYASSCSVYGAGLNEKLTEESKKIPVSVYADTKLKSEVALAAMADEDFAPCFLRNATVFGLSPRMRFDLAVNAMAKYVVTKNKVQVFGGGKQWRPFVHVEDVADAFIKALEASIDRIRGNAFNVGSNELNFQMGTLAALIKKCFPEIEIEIIQEDPDKRSYNVCFDKITAVLDFEAKKTIEDGVYEIAAALKRKTIEDPEHINYYNIKLLKEEATKNNSKSFLPFALPLIEKEEEREVIDTLSSGWITTGPKTKLFEDLMRSYIGCRHAIALNSCTGALHLALVALGIGKGDEVITSPVTWPSTVNVIIHSGATPVFVDINKQTLNMDLNKLEEKISEKTKAIIPVDMAGQPCGLSRIVEIARKHNLHIIEDAAHAIGAEYKGKKIGNIDGITASCFSFYPIKNITTIEGGLVATNDDNLAEKIRILSLHGISKDAWKRYSDKGTPHWQVIMPGWKYNMTDVQASLGIHQIKKLDKFIETRDKYKRMYDEAFGSIHEIILPREIEEIKHSRHLYIIMLALEKLRINRDEFIALMKEAGIGTGVHFISMHLQPYYREKFGFNENDFPNAKYISDRIVSLPLYPKMTENDISRVIQTVKEIVEKNKTMENYINLPNSGQR
ncbi:aminotransferase class I/II-fold pyridoxal phosphate-dependent enzyme [Candidatus Pacearchaeota archaeon]|nr:aminotransferase class I/II-fold pyridoxal phosphate-dependent enzyme [Candidatus Pacearchaeota archaeon]